MCSYNMDSDEVSLQIHPVRGMYICIAVCIHVYIYCCMYTCLHIKVLIYMRTCAFMHVHCCHNRDEN